MSSSPCQGDYGISFYPCRGQGSLGFLYPGHGSVAKLLQGYGGIALRYPGSGSVSYLLQGFSTGLVCNFELLEELPLFYRTYDESSLDPRAVDTIGSELRTYDE